jgi:hypothetical protein
MPTTRVKKAITMRIAPETYVNQRKTSSPLKAYRVTKSAAVPILRKPALAKRGSILVSVPNGLHTDECRFLLRLIALSFLHLYQVCSLLWEILSSLRLWFLSYKFIREKPLLKSDVAVDVLLPPSSSFSNGFPGSTEIYCISEVI